jgi:hypothetical protein
MMRNIAGSLADVTPAANEQLDAVNGQKAVSRTDRVRCAGEGRKCLVREHRASYGADAQ